MEQKVSQELWSLGITSRIKGDRYIKEAILLCIETENYNPILQLEIYPVIAEKNNTTIASVERLIRYAIAKSDRKINNRDFICEMVEKIVRIDLGSAVLTMKL